MGKVSFKPGTMLNPVPVVMVSCGSMEEKNILTIAWTGIINSEPPITYVSVRKSRYSHELIEKTNEFVINLCTEDLTNAADFCGVRTGRNMDLSLIHISEPTRLGMISYAVFCLKKKKKINKRYTGVTRHISINPNHITYTHL